MKKLNRHELKEWITTTSVASVIAYVIFYFIGWVIACHSSRISFFSLPENAHYTDYNTPHSVSNALMIGAWRNPDVYWFAMIPEFLILTVVGYNFIKALASDYRYRSSYE